jgi:hypothetical protein
MNIDDLQSTWQNQSGNISTAIQIDEEKLGATEQNQQMKVFNQMRIFRTIEGVVFLIILVSLWHYILDDFSLSAPKVSAIILNVFATIGLAGNIGQIALISMLDFAKPIKAMQKNIYLICSHKLQLTRLAILSVPFYMAYVFLGFDLLFGIDIFLHMSVQAILIYCVSTLMLLIGIMWVLVKLSYKNIATLWVEKAIRLIVGDPLVEMAKFTHNVQSKYI